MKYPKNLGDVKHWDIETNPCNSGNFCHIPWDMTYDGGCHGEYPKREFNWETGLDI